MKFPRMVLSFSVTGRWVEKQKVIHIMWKTLSPDFTDLWQMPVSWFTTIRGKKIKTRIDWRGDSEVNPPIITLATTSY